MLNKGIILYNSPLISRIIGGVRTRKVEENMKRYLPLLTLILFLLLTLNYTYSKFDLISSSSFPKESMNIGENYYLAYGLQWNSFIKPRMVNIELRDTDGLVLDENHNQIEIISFIDTKGHTGTLNELGFLDYSEKAYINYVSPKDVKVRNHNTLVLRIKLKDISTQALT